MGYVLVLSLIVTGALAAYGLIVAKQPNAKQLLDKITPVQGIIGIVALIWGIWMVITALRTTALIDTLPGYWFILLASGVVQVILGFLLGYGLIQQYALSKNPAAMARGEQAREKLVKFQVPVGLASIALGVLLLVAITVGF